jgi:hypothetical protein
MSNASAIATTEFGAACLLEVITEFKSLVQNFQMHFNRNACAFHVEHNFTSGTRINGPLSFTAFRTNVPRGSSEPIFPAVNPNVPGGTLGFVDFRFDDSS